MSRALLKNTFREIMNTKARFISIVMIIALGVGFFVGVKSTSPSMMKMAEDYYADTQLMDFRLVSTVGFDDDDVKHIEKEKSVVSVMPSYFSDVLVSSGGTASVIRLMGAPTSYEDYDIQNEPVLINGRMPQKNNEIAVDNGAFSNYEIGDTMNIDPTVGDTDMNEQLKTLSFKVVGIIQSPLYISSIGGTTNVGNGKLSGYAYIPPNCFKTSRYTEIYVKTEYSQNGISPFSDEYTDNIDIVSDSFETLGKQRAEVFTKENIDKAQKELDENKSKYETEKSDAEKELADAQKKIDDAQKEYDSKIASAQSEIINAKEQISSGEQELAYNTEKYKKSLADFNTKTDEGERQLKTAEDEYKKQYDEFYTITQPQLNENITALSGAITAVANGAIAQAQSSVTSEMPPQIGEILSDSLSRINSGENAGDVLRELENGIAVYIDAFSALFSTAIAKCDEYQAQYDMINGALLQGEQQLADAKEKIDESRAKLETETEKYRLQLQSAKEQLDNAGALIESMKAKVDSGEQELTTAKTEGLEKLNNSKDELKKAKKEAEDKFAEAEQKLKDAQEKIDSVGSPKWYVFTRDNNPGYPTFTEDANRVDAVATVFPLFFLLVALLVCFTTMTRLVEEKRTEIGTMKALGYSNGGIVAKFLIYSLSACALGCAVGCALGIPILPKVIYNAYKMLYSMRDIEIVISTGDLLLAVLAATFCCGFVSLFSCYKALRHKPSTLMRPKSPKPGKRIFMERITPLWKHLSFTSKVTARNIFRYKSRFLMTVIGIAGCTALIVAAFGLYDAISDIVGIQYNEINRYNMMIMINQDKIHNDYEDFNSKISSDSRFDRSLMFMEKSVSLSSDNKQVDDGVYLAVPYTPSQIGDVIKLRERESQKDITLSDDGVVLTEKLASKLSVSQGDTVYIGADSDKAVKVSAICENYIFGYIYMTPDMYHDIYSKSVEYNMVLANIHGTDKAIENEIGSDYLDDERVSAVTFNSDSIKDFQDMISSMNLIVLVMIICAGALAIVVQYNLTNINLAERNREIATIKVLGFNHKETASFVYRENIILTVFGIAAGLLLGVWLARFIIVTVEIDKVMFGRTIHPMSYLYAALGTILFSFIVNFIMYFRMKRINMVESLKSIE